MGLNECAFGKTANEVYCDIFQKLEMFGQTVSGRNGQTIRKNSNKIELKYNKIIYPDPPIYSEEIEFFQKLGIEICTPIEYEKNGLSGKKVGISISDPEINEIKSNGQNESHLLRLSQYMANYILGRGATLIYGGDFRKGGYTEQLLQEAQILKDRLKTKNIYLKNYVAWPIYLADTLETKKWIAKYCDLLEIKEIPIDETVSDLIETNKRFLTPDTVDNCYVWSKSLTKMRYEMIKDCNARICAGGKKIGYKGKMPGILEEIIIASELGCPLYLLGGFGGIVHDVCELLQNNKCTDSLTEEWQVSFNKGYKELLQKYKETYFCMLYKKWPRINVCCIGKRTFRKKCIYNLNRQGFDYIGCNENIMHFESPKGIEINILYGKWWPEAIEIKNKEIPGRLRDWFFYQNFIYTDENGKRHECEFWGTEEYNQDMYIIESINLRENGQLVKRAIIIKKEKEDYIMAELSEAEIVFKIFAEKHK